MGDGASLDRFHAHRKWEMPVCRPKGRGYTMIHRIMTAGLLAWLCGSMAIAAESDDVKTMAPDKGTVPFSSDPAAPGARNRDSPLGRRLQQDLVLQQTRDEAIYVSPWLKASFSLAKPEMTFLSVDAVGSGRHPSNLLKPPLGPGRRRPWAMPRRRRQNVPFPWRATSSATATSSSATAKPIRSSSPSSPRRSAWSSSAKFRTTTRRRKRRRCG